MLEGLSYICTIKMFKAGLFSVFFLITSGVCAGQAASFRTEARLQWKPILPAQPVLPPKIRPVVLLPDNSASKLPFFCRLEHSQSTSGNGIPVKFRLGSVEYVDWLEGKPWDPTKF